MADNLSDIAKEVNALKQILFEVVKKLKDSKDGMVAMNDALRDLDIESGSIFNTVDTTTQRIKNNIQQLQQKLQQANGNIGEQYETNLEIERNKRRQHYLETGNFQGIDLWNNMSQNISTFQRAGDAISSSINKYVDFQTKIQTMQLELIKSGWESISQGQTPFMSKSLQITTEYTKTMLDLNTQQTKTMTGAVGTVIGAVVGGALGSIIPGAGTVVGAGVGGAVVGSATSIFSDYFMAEKKKEITEYQKQLETVGMLSNAQKTLQSQKLGIGGYLAMNNQSMGGFAGVEGNLYDLWDKYAGIPGFDMKEMIGTLKQGSLSKQFGNDIGTQTGLATSSIQLGGITGLNNQEIIGYFAEMRMKLNVPVDGLVNRFGELIGISDKLQIPLKQVMSDLMELSVANNKYLFTQNQLDTLYSNFSKEIKEGTVSVQDLKKVMEGMSQTPMDKAIGIGALLQSMNAEDIISKSGTQNPENMRKLLSVMSGMSAPDAGLFLKMISSPEADKNPFMQQMMSDYGFSKGDLKNMQPEMLKMALGGSRIFGSMGDSGGISQLLMEMTSGMFGNQLSPDLFKQGKEIKAIESFGETSKSINTVTDKMKEMDAYLLKNRLPMVGLEIQYNKELTKVVDDINTSLKNGKTIWEAFGESVFNITKLIEATNNKISGGIKTSLGESNKQNMGTFELGTGDRLRNYSLLQRMSGIAMIGNIGMSLAGQDSPNDLLSYMEHVNTIRRKESITGTEPSSTSVDGNYTVNIYTADNEVYKIGGIRDKKTVDTLLEYIAKISK